MTHPVTARLDFGDHARMAAYWGEEAARSIRRAVLTGRPATIEDLDVDHAVRAARLAWWHASALVGGRHGGVPNT